MVYFLCSTLLIVGCLALATGIRNKVRSKQLQQFSSGLSDSRLGTTYIAYLLGFVLMGYSIFLLIKNIKS
jgi:hypothetical protein